MSTSPTGVEPTLPSKRKKTSRIISTLNPDRLTVQDLTDLSGMKYPMFRLFSDDSDSTKGKTWMMQYKTFYVNPRHRQAYPFPPDTFGLLYFRPSLHSHVAAGEIRFRVISKDDIDRKLPFDMMFSRGHDLVSMNGVTSWNIHLINIFKEIGSIFLGFRQILVKDGFLKPTDVAKVEELLKDLPSARSPILDSIADPFVLGMGYELPYLTILHEERVFSGRIYLSFCKPARSTRPRSGKALVRFEVANSSNLQSSPSKAPSNIVLRVLKIIEQPKPQDAELAAKIYKEGELIQRVDPKTGTELGPWCATGSMDFMTPSSLQVLEKLYFKRD